MFVRNTKKDESLTVKNKAPVAPDLKYRKAAKKTQIKVKLKSRGIS